MGEWSKIRTLTIELMSDGSDSELDKQQLLFHYLVLFTFAAGAGALAYCLPLYDKTPYYTSALSGAGWVIELLNDYPECIRSKLGIHKHVFLGLIVALEQQGATSTRHVYIEEQLAIFIYNYVTSLSLCHVYER